MDTADGRVLPHDRALQFLSSCRGHDLLWIVILWIRSPIGRGVQNIHAATRYRVESEGDSSGILSRLSRILLRYPPKQLRLRPHCRVSPYSTGCFDALCWQ